jgi:hypothetical protein
MAYVNLDAFHPLVITRRVGIADAAAVRAMLDWVEGQVRRASTKVALVYDAGHDPVGRPDARARQVGGEWFRSHATLLRERCAGLDLSFPSPLSRGAMTAVFWIATPPVPYAMHGSCEAAVRSAIARLGSVDFQANGVVAALNAAERATRA